MPSMKVKAMVPVMHHGTHHETGEEFTVDGKDQGELESKLSHMVEHDYIEVVGDPLAIVKKRKAEAERARAAAAQAAEDLAKAEAAAASAAAKAGDKPSEKSAKSAA